MLKNSIFQISYKIKAKISLSLYFKQPVSLYPAELHVSSGCHISQEHRTGRSHPRPTASTNRFCLQIQRGKQAFRLFFLLTSGFLFLNELVTELKQQNKHEKDIISAPAEVKKVQFFNNRCLTSKFHQACCLTSAVFQQQPLLYMEKQKFK